MAQLAARVGDGGAGLPPGALSRLLHTASDLWQARALLVGRRGDPGVREPAQKRTRVASARREEPCGALARLAGCLREAAAGDDLAVELRERGLPAEGAEAEAEAEAEDTEEPPQVPEDDTCKTYGGGYRGAFASTGR